MRCCYDAGNLLPPQSVGNRHKLDLQRVWVKKAVPFFSEDETEEFSIGEELSDEEEALLSFDDFVEGNHVPMAHSLEY